jgi:hypothetical protein
LNFLTLKDGTNMFFPKRRYITTTQRCVISHKTADLTYIQEESFLLGLLDHCRWDRKVDPKRRYRTTNQRWVTSQKTAALTYIQEERFLLGLLDPWRWDRKVDPKRRHRTNTECCITSQKSGYAIYRGAEASDNPKDTTESDRTLITTSPWNFCSATHRRQNTWQYQGRCPWQRAPHCHRLGLLAQSAFSHILTVQYCAILGLFIAVKLGSHRCVQLPLPLKDESTHRAVRVTR